MKIGTNPIGNYSPIYKKAVVAKPEAKLKVADNEAISNNEKAFFSKMYPNNKEQILEHHFYMKDGNMKGVTIGSLFDRRG
jgi:hypothetical protein